MRDRRFGLLESLLRDLQRPLRIIDIGGTVDFWQFRGWAGRHDVEITLVNLQAVQTGADNIRSVTGDARNLKEFADRSYDIAFSNSVIEHVGAIESQARMANEVKRIANGYWVQTPNYWFPMEPHFLFPGWQWLPFAARVALIKRRAFGWNGRCQSDEMAHRVVNNVHLLSRRQLNKLFPEATFHAERFAGLVKSWIAVGGTLAAELQNTL